MIVGISGKKQSGKNTVALIWQYLYDYYNYNYKHPITVEDFKEYVKNNHHLKSVWIQKSFAHKIKQITCILLGCTMEQLEDPIFKETPLGEEWWSYRTSSGALYPYLTYPGNVSRMELIIMTPRLLLQLLGTEFGRDMVHPDIWVNSLMNEYIYYSGYSPGEYICKCDECGVTFTGAKRSIRCSNCNNFRQKWLVTDVRFPNEAKAIKDKGGILIRVDRDSDSKDSHVSENALITYKDWNYVIDNNYSLAELILRVRQIMFKEGIIYE